MTERFDHRSNGKTIPIIPFDVFEAAALFLATGKSEEEVLTRVALTPKEWENLKKAYIWLPSHLGGFDKARYFAGLPDREICKLVLPPRWKIPAFREVDTRMTAHIREAVRQNPYVGPFRDCSWPTTFIAQHPQATLLYYTHDGHSVYFNGKPLTDSNGNILAVDAQSFAVLGGRWLADKNGIYGQGEKGAEPGHYWYHVWDADVASFEVLNLRYARDARQAYYIAGKTIRTKSPEAFAIIPNLYLNFRDGISEEIHQASCLARDHESVYHYGMKLKGAKPDGFRSLGHDYATDGETVWFLASRKPVGGADATSFIVPGPREPHISGPNGGNAVTDRNRPYVRGQPCDPRECVEAWSPFFHARPDLKGWWWHELAGE